MELLKKGVSFVEKWNKIWALYFPKFHPFYGNTIELHVIQIGRLNIGHICWFKNEKNRTSEYCSFRPTGRSLKSAHYCSFGSIYFGTSKLYIWSTALYCPIIAILQRCGLIPVQRYSQKSVRIALFRLVWWLRPHRTSLMAAPLPFPYCFMRLLWFSSKNDA